MGTELIAPCGLHCGMCVMYQATQANNDAALERLLKILARLIPSSATIGVEDLRCDGCRSDRLGFFCRECTLRDCTEQKQFQGCQDCGDFPCQKTQDFPVPTGKKVMLRAIPSIREMGLDTFFEAEEARYHCPSCGQRLHRGVRECANCKAAVDLD